VDSASRGICDVEFDGLAESALIPLCSIFVVSESFPHKTIVTNPIFFLSEPWVPHGLKGSDDFKFGSSYVETMATCLLRCAITERTSSQLWCDAAYCSSDAGKSSTAPYQKRAPKREKEVWPRQPLASGLKLICLSVTQTLPTAQKPEFGPEQYSAAEDSATLHVRWWRSLSTRSGI
jgi:hypothetical protein